MKIVLLLNIVISEITTFRMLLQLNKLFNFQIFQF